MRNCIMCILGFISFIHAINGQTIDSVTCRKAESIIATYLKNSPEYFLYGLDDKYIAGYPTQNKIILCWILPDKGIVKKDTVEVTKDLGNKLFSSSFYKKSFVYSDVTSAHALSHAKYIYFTLRKKDKKIYEFVFPGLVEDTSKSIFPLDIDVHTFIFKNYASYFLGVKY